MKKSILVILVFTVQFISAQNIVSKELGDFNTLRVFDRISVTLVHSNKNKIEISGERNQEVEIVNKNEDLKIRMSLKKLLKGEKINAVLYYKSIDNIQVSEGSYVNSEDTFKSVSFDVNAKERAQIDLKLDVDKINVIANSGGIIKLVGTAKTQDIVVTSGGIVKAKDLKTNQTNVSVNAGGNVELSAKDLVEAKTRAGGTIIIYDSPKEINQKTVLGGTIKEAK